MPINKKFFDEGEEVPRLDSMISNFLLKNPETAFTVEEIIRGIMIGKETNSAHILTAREALRRLLEANLIEARRFPKPEGNDFNIYYMAKSRQV